MPIYEYKCSSCEHTFSMLQRIGQDGSELSCPKCGRAHPEKMFSAFASNNSTGSGYAPPTPSCSSGFG